VLANLDGAILRGRARGPGLESGARRRLQPPRRHCRRAPGSPWRAYSLRWSC